MEGTGYIANPESPVQLNTYTSLNHDNGFSQFSQREASNFTETVTEHKHPDSQTGSFAIHDGAIGIATAGLSRSKAEPQGNAYS